MQTYKWIIICVVCGVVGAGVCYFAESGRRQDGDSAVSQAAAMASIVDGLGQTLEEFRTYRNRTDDHIAFLEANNIEFGNILLSIRADQAELGIRYRELENRLGELGAEVSGIGADVLGVADDIGRTIDSVESAAEEAHP